MRLYIALFCLFLLAGEIPAQKLPAGELHTTRERSIDITHLRLDLDLDVDGQNIEGTACFSLRPLHRISGFDLDAINLRFKNVRQKTGSEYTDIAYRTDRSKLYIHLDREYLPEDTLHICVSYSASPGDGMYFSHDPADPRRKYCYTYGEGGLHANWMPVYNQNDDKFSSEVLVKVDTVYKVISNGRLVAQNDNGVYHWAQEKPHSNYLIVIYAGIFEKGVLDGTADLPPMAYWVPPGNRKMAAYTFRNTPDMITFFRYFTGTAYPWEKYDQVVVPGYAIGGMEHTSATGLRFATLKDSLAPLTSSPDFDTYHQIWTSESLVSHELAHMWFGDLVTCRDLRYIWLNESFATYMQFLWDERYYGAVTFDFDRITALDQYLDDVRGTHLIRPLEYDHFDTPGEMYNEAHTYIKGALILHMLDRILGREDFRRVIRSYLATHAFQNVISRDLYSIILQVTGRDLGWFFEDWIYGAGHPIFEVAYDYLPDIGKLHLKVKQVQPSVEGQDLFRLPVTVTIETSTHRFSEQIEVSEAEQDFLLSCPDYPLMVSFDGAGDLVAEIREEKGFQEWIYQAQYDSTAGRIRALRHLAENHPNNEQTLGLLDQILREETSSWHLRAEAALLSGKTCSSGESTIIQMASKDSDYRVRKALAIGLRRVPNRSVSERLQQLLESETHPDVQATLLVSLSLIDPDACRRLIPDFIGQASWYDEFTIAALKAMQNFAGSEMLNMIKPFTGEKYNYQVRRSAFDAWIQAYPEDPELAERLIDQVSHGDYALRNFSIDALGEIRSTAAEGVLEDVIEKSGDADLRAAAASSLEKIQLGRAKNRSEIYEEEHDVRKRK